MPLVFFLFFYSVSHFSSPCPLGGKDHHEACLCCAALARNAPLCCPLSSCLKRVLQGSSYSPLSCYCSPANMTQEQSFMTIQQAEYVMERRSYPFPLPFSPELRQCPPAKCAVATPTSCSTSWLPPHGCEPSWRTVSCSTILNDTQTDGK